MEIGPLVALVAIAVGVAAGLMGVALLAVWKSGRRERWLAALAPLAMAGGFVAGYACFLPFPRGWGDEAWMMAVIVAGLEGVLLAAAVRELVEKGIWRGIGEGLLLAAVVLATWLTVRRFGDERWHYMGMLGGGLLVYLASWWGAGRELRLWALGPLAMLLSGFAATFVTMAWIDFSIGRMLVMVTALAGLSLVVGIVRPLRAAARGATGFLAVMFAVLLGFAARYRSGGEIPWWVFPWLGAGPVAMAIAWVPGLRRRPRLCAAVVGLVTLAIVVPAALVAKKYAPEFEM